MSDLKKQKLLLKWNTISSLVYQITTIVCGFIIPRLILVGYGSSVNGLVLSIKQFLGIISFLEMGVGAVVQSALYKPLAEKNEEKTNQIMTSANIFFTRIGLILLVYVIVLFFAYPLSVHTEFEWLYTALLVGAISISFFAQYFFGIVDRLYLNSAQRGYIQYNSQTITLILNAIAGFILIKLNSSIQIFQLVSSLIFLARPAYLRVYVNHHYNVNRHVKYDKEPIEQKWNGIAQHVAAIVLDGTDVIVLTLFSTLENVSIYAVYNLVITGVKNLALSLTNGIQALEGELWAKQDLENLIPLYKKTEWLIHMGTVLVFSCVALLVTPFVQVYTAGVNDADYYQPLFAVLISAANAGHCLRLPYNLMILAAGHFKQTQRNYIVAALLNIAISIIAVFSFGLIGVAIGTMIAMVYQTIWMAAYTSNNLIKGTIKSSLKILAVDIITVVAVYLSSFWMKMFEISYFGWCVLAIKTFGIACIVILVINIVFYKDYVKDVFNKFGLFKH